MSKQITKTEINEIYPNDTDRKLSVQTALKRELQRRIRLGMPKVLQLRQPFPPFHHLP